MRILILEDDLGTLTKLLEYLARLENSLDLKVSVTVFSEFWQVEEHLNSGTKEKFDFILLDRDCKIGGSFHILNLDKFPEAVVIGISSVPRYNQELRDKGIKLIVDKDYNKLDEFAQKVMLLIREYD
ncbi:MAG: hypothetical protein WC699_18485 [Bacteroidales bacterium]|jgi:hypothetical protein